MPDQDRDGAGAQSRLPVHLSGFVGRDRELAELADLVRGRRGRLLTLIGPGGMGKTRLAVELARTTGPDFEDGVCWVDLSGLVAASHVPHAVIEALGVGESPGESVEGRLVHLLVARQVLLVLDNCEHLLSGVRALADTLLKRCPHLVLVATSRELLDLTGEILWPVPPLRAEDHANGGEEANSEAVRLFVQRAESQGRFRAGPDTAATVEEICRLVDGIPLAIELAAAQTRSLGVSQIAERLRAGIDVLGPGRGQRAGRQSSMFAALEWSYRLLDEAEREVLMCLSVFRGPFSLDAALAITIDDFGLFDLMARLVEKSMVHTEELVAGSYHYVLLTPIRQFAAEKLAESPDAEDRRRRHLEFYRRLAADSVPGLRGPDQEHWLARLRAEDGNLRQALSYGLRSEAGDEGRQIALEIASNLFWYWNASDRFREALAWLEQCLESTDGASSSVAGDVLLCAGTCAWLLGDLGKAGQLLAEARVRYRDADDRLGQARVADRLGRVSLYRGDPSAAAADLTHSADVFRQAGSPHDLGQSLTGLSVALALTGRHEEARDAAQTALDIFRSIGDPFFHALALGDLGWVQYLGGDLTSAIESLEASLELRRQIDSRWLTAQTLNQLAEVERFAGRRDQAIGHLEESLVVAEDVGARAWMATGLRDLGLVALRDHDPAAAAVHLSKAIEHFRSLENRQGLAQCLEGLAAVAAAQARSGEARRLLAEAEPHRQSIGPPTTPTERDDFAWIGDQLGGTTADRAPAATPEYTSPRLSGFGLRIETLGATRVERAGVALRTADWTYAKPRQLFFYLLDSGARTRNEIGLALWPDVSTEQLGRNLRSALYHLRQALGDRDWVLYESGRYRFNRLSDTWIDVEEFERLLGDAGDVRLSNPVRAVQALSQAIDLYRGDYLADIGDDDWAMARREELRRLCVDAHLTTAALVEAAADPARAAGSYRRVIELEPYHEPALLGLMSALASQGDRAGALREYEEMAARLREDLGASPPPAAGRLADDIRAGHTP
jgi:predicted ATPase/DNA-binding SARP family transcriptional activator/tRNA C32,U32 (ribose-2'-O)-methylase TrmJ